MTYDHDEFDNEDHDGKEQYHNNGQDDHQDGDSGQNGNVDPEDEKAVNELLMVSLFAATMSANAGSLRGQLGMLRGKFESGEWPDVVQRSYEQVEMATEMLASEYERIAKKVIDDYRAQHLQDDQDTPDDSP